MMCEKWPWYRRVALRLPRKILSGRKEDQPYMIRYYIHRGSWFSIYLHRIMRSDDTQDFHDHPWPFFHFILEQGYYEEIPHKKKGSTKKFRRPGYWRFHLAHYAHRVELKSSRESWSLVIVGNKSREWGFIDRIKHCWTSWENYNEGVRR